MNSRFVFSVFVFFNMHLKKKKCPSSLNYYTTGIRISKYALCEMDREIRLGLDNRSIAEALFTWNGQNNMECVAYEMRKKLNEATITKTTGWCPLLWHFCQEIISGLGIEEVNNNNNNNNNDNDNNNSIEIPGWCPAGDSRVSWPGLGL